MSNSINLLFLLTTTSYHVIATWIENRRHQPPGQLIDIGGYKLHLYSKGQGNPTVVLDHSLGGIEGYFLVEEIAQLGCPQIVFYVWICNVNPGVCTWHCQTFGNSGNI
jgi:hypothetical protein